MIMNRMVFTPLDVRDSVHGRMACVQIDSVSEKWGLIQNPGILLAHLS
jgi:hypothetical protein